VFLNIVDHPLHLFLADIEIYGFLSLGEVMMMGEFEDRDVVDSTVDLAV